MCSWALHLWAPLSLLEKHPYCPPPPLPLCVPSWMSSRPESPSPCYLILSDAQIMSPKSAPTTSPHSSTRQPERKRAQAGNNGSLGLATSWVQINLIHNSFIPNLARGESNASIPFYLILFYVSVLDIIITIMLLASTTLEHNVEIKCPAINHLEALLPTLIILSLLWRTTRIWAGLS